MATPTSLPATFVAGNVLTAAQMNDLRGAFRILQVVSTTKTDVFSTTSTGFVDVTGFSVSITPTSTTSKVFVIATINLNADNNSGHVASAKLVRDSTDIAVSADGISFGFGQGGTVGETQREPQTYTIAHLDSPATTSATTYKVQIASIIGATLYFNRWSSSGWKINTASITAVEVSA